MFVTKRSLRRSDWPTPDLHSFDWIQCVLVAACCIFLASCQSNPYTERSQLLLVPLSYENQMGQQAYQQVLDDPEIQISQDSQTVELVQQVASRVIEAAKQSKYSKKANAFDWNVSVIQDDKTMNAFALPGGKIAVYTGIFPVAKNTAGLAAIMGHEVVHALARHGAERMSHGLVTQAGLTAAAIALQTQGLGAVGGQAMMAALGLGAQVGVVLPFSRAHESEADYIGLLLAAEAGYDPREAVRVWQRMKQATEGQPPEFLSTHPGHDTRIRHLEDWMPEALTRYRNAPEAPVQELPSVQ